MTSLKNSFKKKLKSILGLFLVFTLLISNASMLRAEIIGSSLENLRDIPVIFVENVEGEKESIKEKVNDIRSLVYRYELHEDAATRNVTVNGRPYSETPPAETVEFAARGYKRLRRGDKVSYINRFGKKVNMTAMTVVPDFYVGDDKKAPFEMGTQNNYRIAEMEVEIEGDNNPTHVGFVDLDYSDNVGIRKSDIQQIIVTRNTRITYEERGGYITFHGLQGRNATVPNDPTAWVTVLLKSSTYRMRFGVGNKTLLYSKAHLFTPDVEIGGSVHVKYVTDTDVVLEDRTAVSENDPIGYRYQTEEKTFNGYRFKEMKEASAPASGEVKAEDQEIIYVYEANPETGSVYARYETETGEILEDNVVVVENAQVGTEYSATAKEFDGYEFVRKTEDSAPESGRVTRENQTVVYVYRAIPKRGTVYLVHEKEDGSVLREKIAFVENVAVGTRYETEKDTFEGYEFSRMKEDSAPAIGEVKEGEQTVTYVYREVEKRGSVYVVHEKEDGSILKERVAVVENEVVGTNYETQEESFEGYEFSKMKEDSAPARGTVKEEEQTVTYVYRPVSVNPPSDNPSTDNPSDNPDTGNSGENPNAGEPSGNPNTDNPSTDNPSDNPNTDNPSDNPNTGNSGENPSTGEPNDNPSVDNPNSNPNNDNPKDNSNVRVPNYSYRERVSVSPRSDKKETFGNVYVKYVTLDGEILEDKTILYTNAKVGSEYKVSPKHFDKYSFVRRDESFANDSGEIIEGDLLVVYLYEKNKETVKENKVPKTSDNFNKSLYLSILSLSLLVVVLGLKSKVRLIKK